MANPREAIPMASASSPSPTSLSPPQIPMELHEINRANLIKSLQEHLSSSSRPLQAFVFLQGGEEQTRHCTDHTELFRQESYFAYLFGVREPGFYGAIDVATGESILFAPRLPAEYAVWLGEIKPLSFFKERYMVSMVFYTDEIVKVLHDRIQGSGKPMLFLLHGLNTDSNKYSKPADFEMLQDGDMALLDMGAEYHFYGSDITCSFPVNGKFTSDQCLVYNAVLSAHNAVISSMKPGVSWVDMHQLAEKIILESLKKGCLLVGDVDEMMAERLGSVFMPHGLGHFLGIDTHDPGGYLKGAKRPSESGLKALRTSRELQEGMVITVEPGCYFIDALLIPAMESSHTSKFFNCEEIGRFKGFGGVRIESDLHVTANGCVNMTKVPRETWEIEAVMAGESWPLKRNFVCSENGGEC